MNYKNLQEENGEILSVEDEKLSRLIGSLKRVEAPKDFDFHLKARIANAKPSEFQPRFMPVLRYVLPLSVAVFILAFIIFNGAFFVDNQSAPMVAENNSPAPVQAQILPNADLPFAPQVETGSAVLQKPENGTPVEIAIPSKSAPKNKETVVANKSQLIAVKSEKTTTNVLPKADEPEDSGNSRVSASTGTKVITPQGINLNKPAEQAPEIENQGSFSIGQVLSQFFGVETLSENGKLKVKAVKGKSIGDASGVKAGDIIEAIDGAKISETPLNSKTIEVKKITVQRGTETIEI